MGMNGTCDDLEYACCGLAITIQPVSISSCTALCADGGADAFVRALSRCWRLDSILAAAAAARMPASAAAAAAESEAT
jgi:hypothetical protein